MLITVCGWFSISAVCHWRHLTACHNACQTHRPGSKFCFRLLLLLVLTALSVLLCACFTPEEKLDVLIKCFCQKAGLELFRFKSRKAVFYTSHRISWPMFLCFFPKLVCYINMLHIWLLHVFIWESNPYTFYTSWTRWGLRATSITFKDIVYQIIQTLS